MRLALLAVAIPCLASTYTNRWGLSEEQYVRFTLPGAGAPCVAQVRGAAADHVRLTMLSGPAGCGAPQTERRLALARIKDMKTMDRPTADRAVRKTIAAAALGPVILSAYVLAGDRHQQDFRPGRTIARSYRTAWRDVYHWRKIHELTLACPVGEPCLAG